MNYYKIFTGELEYPQCSSKKLNEVNNMTAVIK